MDKRIISSQEAAELVVQQSLEYAIVKNPDDVYPAYEYLPLAPKITTLRNEISAIIMDLKGTSVSIDGLSLLSLEKMIRKISGRITKDTWAGLDSIIDHPNILGLHPKKQVEFLISRYQNFINQDYLKESYFYSILWTLILDYDKEQQKIVREHLIQFGCNDILSDPKILEYIGKNKFDRNNANALTNYILLKYGKCFVIRNYNDTINATLDIFYQQIHEILLLISKNDKETLSEITKGYEEKPLIEPAFGLTPLLALVKGWFEEDIEYVFDYFLSQYKTIKSYYFTLQEDIDITRNRLVTISNKSKNNPIKLALVTTSLPFETNTILAEAFLHIREQIDTWKVPSNRKEFLKEKFSDFNNVFDAIVTNSDINEIRPKPHRDLYSIALKKLKIHKEKFDQVIAFEDGENGLVGSRAAGIGLCAAVPINKINKEFPAAAFTLNGGLLEVLLSYNLFMK